MPTRRVEHPDGTVEYFIDSDDLYAAGMLEDEDAPQLSVDEFDELVTAIGEDQGPAAKEESVEPGSETPKIDGIYVRRRYRNGKGKGSA